MPSLNSQATHFIDHFNTAFILRHIGVNQADTQKMLATIGVETLAQLMEATLPATIRANTTELLPAAINEYSFLKKIEAIGAKNQLYKTYIGQGYYDTITPSVILRNMFQNPGWYTQYTPYQAEIAQGRLESLLNFQTMTADLTGMDIANASMLDEATAAAEAMAMFFNFNNPKNQKKKFFVDENCFQQTITVLKTRALPLGIKLIIGDYKTALLDDSFFGAMVQYPNKYGSVEDYRGFVANVHTAGGYVAMATDLLALTLLESPGAVGADVAVGNSQRFGVPLGYGGPHAAFFAAKEIFKRHIPGRIIGISVDAQGDTALRMALQTREQHIKREKATSNICTAQALLANMAAMYAVYHGAEGLKQIAQRIHHFTQMLQAQLADLGYTTHTSFFDTLTIEASKKSIQPIAEKSFINFNYFDENRLSISLYETTNVEDIIQIVQIFAAAKQINFDAKTINNTLINTAIGIPQFSERKTNFLTAPVFNTHHSETQMMRYLKYLENKDLSLNRSMISLGSCTMKLNAATEMLPISLPAFAQLHPFVPTNQAKGYQEIIDELGKYLCLITGFDAFSMQPNSGAQGEYAGLLCIRNYHIARGEKHRNILLIPISAHGTNPASAVMAGMQVVVIKTNEDGTIDKADLEEKATLHADNLAGMMITYPSTYGVYEEGVQAMMATVHQYGGQVYMDGANMNAQVGLTAPAIIGADVCHLNLHKTFAIPHGGGGPGVGPICVKAHLAPFLPKNPLDADGGAVSAAAFGSASILLISYAYILLLGKQGLPLATQYAILNANYMKAKLQNDFTVLYKGKNGFVAHEFILDLRPFKQSANIEAEDIAKRLMDYGFHAPTMSFPVAGTIMIEPTESEDKAELDRFCAALLAIREEIKQIETGMMDRLNNPLKNAPHTQAIVCAEAWHYPYSRATAAFPLPYLKNNKFWPSVARINNTVGDRNLICVCPPMEAYSA